MNYSLDVTGLVARRGGRSAGALAMAGVLATAAWVGGVTAEPAVEDMGVVEAFVAGFEDGLAEAMDENAAADASTVGWIELTEVLREGPVPFAWVSEQEAGPSLSSVLDQLAFVAGSADHAGVTIYMNQPMISFAQASALRRGVEAVRAAGKEVLFFAEAYDLMDLYLASAGDRVLLQTNGSVELSGLAMEEMYLGETLEKMGVEADLIQIGKFKGADEQFSRTGPSEAWDENIGGLLDGLYSHLIETVAAGRGMSVEAFEAVMAGAMAMTDDELVAAGIIDASTDRSLFDVTEAAFGADFEWDSDLGAVAGAGMPDNPFALFSMLLESPKPRTTRPTIAVLHAYGPIMSGDSSIGDGLFSDDTIGSSTMEQALLDALEDENIQGVVLRIDSPGGSALASEMIYQALEEVGSEKPVYASVGSMAASGGYYLLCGTDRVFVEPGTIVGSIGVVGGKLVLDGLYEWAGVGIKRRSRGPGGDLFNSVEPFTESQRSLVKRSMEVIYEQFLDRVRTGRGDRLVDLSAIDEGMLFTGEQAIENGMADDLGGLGLAVSALADELELEAGAFDVIDLPSAMSLPEYLNSVFGASAPSVSSGASGLLEVSALREVLGPMRWKQASGLLEGLTQLRQEPVLLLHPSAIHVTTGRR